MAQEQVLTERDNGREVTLPDGRELSLSLPENRTTGYRWDLEEEDRGLLETREAEGSDVSPAVGSGGRARWIVRAIAPGTSRLRLKRWRPWEGESSTVERFELTIRVLPR